MKIKMDGVEYEFPSVDSITMDEAIILERYAGIGIEELLPGEDGKTSLPLGAVKGFVVIAVMRENPAAKETEISRSIGKLKLGELQDLVEQDEPETETDALPPAVSAPSERTSGDGSSSDLASTLAAVPLPASGPLPSVTDVTSGRKTSAA